MDNYRNQSNRNNLYQKALEEAAKDYALARKIEHERKMETYVSPYSLDDIVAFIAGANWKDEQIWSSGTDVPLLNEIVVAITDDGFVVGKPKIECEKFSVVSEEKEVENGIISKWCYIKDLIYG